MNYEVVVGQVWRDKDWRQTKRTIRVEHIDGGYAFCRVLTDVHGQAVRVENYKLRRILLRRFKPTSTGYELVF